MTKDCNECLPALADIDSIDVKECVDLVKLGDKILDFCIFDDGEAKLCVQLSTDDNEGAFLCQTNVLKED